jgi:hypothetical protein
MFHQKTPIFDLFILLAPFAVSLAATSNKQQATAEQLSALPILFLKVVCDLRRLANDIIRQ